LLLMGCEKHNTTRNPNAHLTSLHLIQGYYGDIINSTNVFGHLNTSVLVQEFLSGKEYVVDSVSVEGVHKTVAIWEYDKRPTNGAQFVYYGMRLYESSDGSREQKLVEYMHGVLESLQVKNGPSHGEVMWTSTGPCLIEVGSRPHGGEGTFVTLADGCIGYNQLGVMVDAHENRSKFFKLPGRPQKLAAHATEVCLINYHEGTLLDYPGMEEVKSLPSFVEAEMKMHIGEHFPVTVDFLTSPGAIMLMHESKEVMERDAERIHELCKEGLFSVRRMRSGTL
jgi:biotin carboxylase